MEIPLIICGIIPTMRRIFQIAVLITLLVLVSPAQVSAQSFSARDVIAAVNNLRQNQGLVPYEIDSSLMAYAQEHSEYQAKTGITTHTHSDGTSPGSHGITENIASGTASYMTLDFLLYTIWSDSLHMNTMIGYETGYVGAGVAVNGSTVYITLDVRPGNRVSSSTGLTGGSATTAATSIALVPLVTATPNADGAIVHVVGYGQSLWSIAIAYGVKIDDIRKLNGLIAGSTDIYAGQKLVIRPAGSVTPQSTASQLPTDVQTLAPQGQPSKTPVPPAIVSTATLQLTDTPTLTVTGTSQPIRTTPLNLSGLATRKTLALLLILVGAAGAGWVLLSGFRGRE